MPDAMKLQQLATALHGHLNGKWINIQGPGHGSNDRSLGIWFDRDAPDGFRIHSLAGNDPTVCRTYVIGLLKKLAVSNPLKIEPQTNIGEDTAIVPARIHAALAIWNEAVPAQGTIVEKCLAARGCDLTPDIIAADALRFHPCCPFKSHRFPAMVALMRNVITGEPTGIHRTALKDDGSHKQNMPDGMSAKMMLGAPKLAAIRLWPSAEHLGIAEGIETALAKIFEIPVWAVMSAEGIASFPVISGLTHLKIFADHDYAGMRAACKCGRRYEMSGIEDLALAVCQDPHR
jgi:putative DNA primase/helicase